jgi:hypothetical protein
MNPWLILGVVLAVGAAGGAGLLKGRDLGKAEVQQQWDNERAAQQAQFAKDQEAAREKEQLMQAQADRLRQEKDREIKNLNARAIALTSSLQQRADRATTISEGTANPSTGQGGPRCTGAELSRQDAEFLAGEAARADSLRLALQQCQTQYDAVRAGIK